MSANNGVYVLETLGPQYRVAYAHNIDSIYGKFNDDTGHWQGNFEMIRNVFVNSPVFSELSEAFDFAEKLDHNYPYLEDGICHIRDFRNLDFNSL